jgi:hypothetical protein
MSYSVYLSAVSTVHINYYQATPFHVGLSLFKGGLFIINRLNEQFRK